jgi:hypothetical protein
VGSFFSSYGNAVSGSAPPMSCWNASFEENRKDVQGHAPGRDKVIWPYGDKSGAAPDCSGEGRLRRGKPVGIPVAGLCTVRTLRNRREGVQGGRGGNGSRGGGKAWNAKAGVARSSQAFLNDCRVKWYLAASAGAEASDSICRSFRMQGRIAFHHK